SHSYSLRHAPPKAYNRTSEWADQNLTQYSMVLARAAPFWINKNIPSFAPGFSDDSLTRLSRIKNQKVYDGLYIFEPTRKNPKSGLFESMEPLPVMSRLTTETVWEFEADIAYGARILRVTEIDTSPVRPGEKFISQEDSKLEASDNGSLESTLPISELNEHNSLD
ncbi:MAG: hypothetical protein ACQKBT_02025, partial [Puniceicoccales bacterium]